ncbi:MAG: radical SAM protein [Caldisericia bacterium]|nr:radical SAM protein [Caldisericia bacterium]
MSKEKNLAFCTEKAISFIPTYRCNLNCLHCCVEHRKEELDLSLAFKVLKEAFDCGIKTITFTGGEPFLCFELLFAVMKKATSLGFKIEDLSTNGAWWRNINELRQKFSLLKEVGFDGPFHLSIDAFHKVNPIKWRYFIEEAIEIFKREDIIQIDSRTLPNYPADPFIEKIAILLKGSLNRIEKCRGEIRSSVGKIPYYIEEVCLVGKASFLGKPIYNHWFGKNACKEMIRVIVVEPGGNVRHCTGYVANRYQELFVGNVREHSLKEIITKALNHPFVGSLIRNCGPLKIKEDLEQVEPSLFKEPISNPCYFCDYILKDSKSRKILSQLGYL